MVTSAALATAAARYPSQCVMLPTMPGGHRGAPRSPVRIGAGGTPSLPSAILAHSRPVVNSRRRLSTARATTSASCGKSPASAESANASAQATAAGRISSSTSVTPRTERPELQRPFIIPNVPWRLPRVPLPQTTRRVEAGVPGLDAKPWFMIVGSSLRISPETPHDHGRDSWSVGYSARSASAGRARLADIPGTAAIATARARPAATRTANETGDTTGTSLMPSWPAKRCQA